MTEPTESKNEVPLENSIPEGGVPLESILCTEELQRRESRPPDYEKENRAIVVLMSALADLPSTIFKTLAETILDITQCDSAGLSLLTRDGKKPDVYGKRFYWPAITGMWSPHVGGGTPRNFGPCGDVLDQNRTLLFSHFERRYPYLMPVIPAAEECLLVPFYVSGQAVGTIWAIMHSDRRKFDAEDDRVMASLGKFASSAYQAVQSIEDLKFQVAEREKAEKELRDLSDGLERQVRARTEELEQRNKQLAEAKTRLAEEKMALERSETYLEEAQRLSHSGSWYWNISTGEVFWSKEFFAIFGFDAERIRASHSLHLERVHPDDRSKLENVRQMAIRNKEDFETEYRLVLPGGSIKYVHSVGRCSSGESGDVEFSGAIMDITERKRAEEERERLRQLEADLAHINRVSMMGELAASLAHEIKQPIAAAVVNAKTCARWLQRDQPDVAEACAAVSRVVADATRAADTVERVRSLYKRGTPSQELVDGNEVIRQMSLLLYDKGNQCSVSIRTELDAGLRPIAADRVQLQQVLMNLMLNGIEAMKDMGGELVVTSKRTADGQLLISVSDSGVGLPVEEPERIFETFFTTKTEGSGMGLPISQKIVESHGGHLWANANADRGATFQFTLPTEAKASSTSA